MNNKILLKDEYIEDYKNELNHKIIELKIKNKNSKDLNKKIEQLILDFTEEKTKKIINRAQKEFASIRNNFLDRIKQENI